MTVSDESSHRPRATQFVRNFGWEPAEGDSLTRCSGHRRIGTAMALCTTSPSPRRGLWCVVPACHLGDFAYTDIHGYGQFLPPHTQSRFKRTSVYFGSCGCGLSLLGSNCIVFVPNWSPLVVVGSTGKGIAHDLFSVQFFVILDSWSTWFVQDVYLSCSTSINFCSTRTNLRIFQLNNHQLIDNLSSYK